MFVIKFNKRQSRRLRQIGAVLDKDPGEVIQTSLGLLTVCWNEIKKGNKIGICDKDRKLKKIVTGIHENPFL